MWPAMIYCSGRTWWHRKSRVSREKIQRLSPIPISSPDSTRKLLGPEHLGNLILQFRLCGSVLPSPKCTVGVAGTRDRGTLALITQDSAPTGSQGGLGTAG